jgi:hypothetical protein
VEPGELLVLRRQPREGRALKCGQVFDGGVPLGDPGSKLGVLLFEPSNLGVAWVGGALGLREELAAAVELVGEVLVRARDSVLGVEAGAVHVG